MKKRDYEDYVQDILDSIVDMENFVKGLSFDEFSKDKKTVNAVVRSLEIIGEASKKVPESVRKQYPKLPWKEMAKMRDKLIHGYFGIDLEIVWKVLKDEIPPLTPIIKKMLKDSKEK